MGVMTLLFHLQKCFLFDIFFKNIGILDSYFIHRYIIIKYRLFDLGSNLSIIMRVMALFSSLEPEA